MSLSIIENFSYHCKYKIRKLIKTVMINIGTWYTSKRHRYNDTLPKSSYPHYGKKVTGNIYHGTRKRKGHDTKESWDKENWMTLWNIKTWMKKKREKKIITIMEENKLKLQLWWEHRQCKRLAKSHLSKEIREKGEFIIFYINKWVILLN